MIKKANTELKDLDVDRVDGVDKPATGRSFLLFKGEDGDAVMKGYGLTATAAATVLNKMRTDKHAVVSQKSAIALNGLAQVLGQDPVFVGKSVPTQPYVFTEPDADKRGPADEDLGGNFTPRSMPGSMVGSVSFRLKDEEDDEDASKTAKSKAKAAYDEDDEDAKGKTKAADEPDADDAMDASEKANRGVARSIGELAEAMKGLPGAIAKAVVDAERAEITKMQGGTSEPEAEPVKKAAKSRQIDEDEPVKVRKGAGGYEPKFGVGFSDVVFGGKR